ncbi:MAG: hypothetical protein H0T19_06850 [Thermoleophilaceae bacterium]|nr:hypothetical protein [Thermoleophilaceae bacterium]
MILKVSGRGALQGEVFVLWRPDRAEKYPELVEAVEAFDPGPRPAAEAAATWLRDDGLRDPPESVARLYVASGKLLGFYALANGDVELTSSHRKKADLQRPTQPAVVLTWIAKSTEHEVEGGLLVAHATGVAREAAEISAATVFALDPFDEETAEMWRLKGFRNSRTPVPGEAGLKRMWIPLQTS